MQPSAGPRALHTIAYPIPDILAERLQRLPDRVTECSIFRQKRSHQTGVAQKAVAVKDGEQMLELLLSRLPFIPDAKLLKPELLLAHHLLAQIGLAAEMVMDGRGTD